MVSFSTSRQTMIVPELGTAPPSSYFPVHSLPIILTLTHYVLYNATF